MSSTPNPALDAALRDAYLGAAQLQGSVLAALTMADVSPSAAMAALGEACDRGAEIMASLALACAEFEAIAKAKLAEAEGAEAPRAFHA